MVVPKWFFANGPLCSACVTTSYLSAVQPSPSASTLEFGGQLSDTGSSDGTSVRDLLIIDADHARSSLAATTSSSGGPARWSKPRVLLLTGFFLFLGSYLFLPLVCKLGSNGGAAAGMLAVSCSDGRRPSTENADDIRTDDNDGTGQQEEPNPGAAAHWASSDAREGDSISRIRFPRTRRRLPQCIIIGVRKCGTRALLEFLNVHSHVVKATQEVHFFDDDSRYSLGLEWYRRKMPYSFADQITIEKSPSYFVTPNAPHRIYAMNRAVRLLIIVRDPVTRAVSDYTQIHANRLSKGKRHDASFESLALAKDGSVNTDYKALQISLYADHLWPWLQVFPRQQVHVVDGDRLVTDPFPELQRIEYFLGLEHRITRENFYFNKTKGFYCVRNETMDKCLSEAKGRKHPPIPGHVVNKLRRFYAPHNERFFAMVGQNFSWDGALQNYVQSQSEE